MSRAWIAFYMGDYQKDTNRLTTLEHGAYFLLLQECWTHGQIPSAPEDRAAIVKMPLKDWLKIAPKIGAYFNEDGTQKRATKEIEKAEATRLRKAVAGHLGGTKSGISRAIKQHNRSRREAELQARHQPEPKLSEATLNSKITSSEVGTAREAEPVETQKGPSSGLAAKPPLLTPSAELIASLAKRTH
jgi:uncharacterized protein YdaU (DUF1376 family)